MVNSTTTPPDSTSRRSGPPRPIRATHWEAPTAFPLDLATLPVGGPETALAVYANHGRWVVECPDCHGAQLATPADPRFLCNFCANASTGGTWRPVAWPPNRAAIETLLEVRPNEENRNWLPGETEALLDAENRVHLDPPTPPDVVTTLRGR